MPRGRPRTISRIPAGQRLRPRSGENATVCRGCARLSSRIDYGFVEHRCGISGVEVEIDDASFCGWGGPFES
jgi:hypothetical protein